jgi:hypothetical protein
MCYQVFSDVWAGLRLLTWGGWVPPVPTPDPGDRRRRPATAGPGHGHSSSVALSTLSSTNPGTTSPVWAAQAA